MLLKIALDMLVLAGITSALRSDELDWMRLFFVALIMSLVNFALGFLASTIGLLVIVPIVISNTFVLTLFYYLPMRGALIAAGVLFVYNLSYFFLIAWMYSS